MNLDQALTQYDRTEANLRALEEVVMRMDETIPGGIVFSAGSPEAREHDELRRRFGHRGVGHRRDDQLVPCRQGPRGREQLGVGSGVQRAEQHDQGALGHLPQHLGSKQMRVGLDERRFQRHQRRDQFRQFGAHVVDAPADVFASKVADAYLDLKAAGRL
jgi:hypothetical protein